MEVKPGYKQTEVGVIPEEWDVCRLSSLLEQPRSVRYGIVQPGKYEASGCLMLRSQDYSKGWTQPGEMHRVSSDLENEYKNAGIQGGDLIMTVVGAGIGQVVVAPDWLHGAILSRSTARIAVDESRASRGFIQASLQSPVGKRQILDCQKEGAQPVVSCQDLAKFSLPYPPLREQRAIAEALSDVDHLLGGLDRLITKKRDLKQAAMQQLLTGQTRLPGFHGEWETKRLGDLGSTYGGLTGKTKAHFGDGSAHYVTFMNVMSNVVVDCGAFERVKASPTEAQNRVVKGDLLFNGSSETPEEVAMCAVMSRDVPDLFLNSFCFGFRFRKGAETDGLFLAYYLRNKEGRELMKSLAQGSTRYNLSKVALLNSPLRLPSFAEQTAIAKVLTDIDGELAALEQRRDKTRALRQSMMQELLTGKTRLL